MTTTRTIIDDTVEALLELEADGSGTFYIYTSQTCDDCELLDLELVRTGETLTIAIAEDGSILPSGIRADTASLFYGKGVTFAAATWGPDVAWALARRGVVA